MILLATQFRIGDEAILLVAALDVVEQHSLGIRIGGAKLLRALEHQVLQVVGETGGLGGIVLRAGAHSNEGLDARLLGVYGEVDFQAVVEGVDAGLHLVALHSFVLVVLGRCGSKDGAKHDDCAQDCFLHIVVIFYNSRGS